MKNILWKCSDRKLKDSNLYKFENFLKNKYKINYKKDYQKLWEWSVNNQGEFCFVIALMSLLNEQLGHTRTITSL